jgi:hypothetical protein
MSRYFVVVFEDDRSYSPYRNVTEFTEQNVNASQMDSRVSVHSAFECDGDMDGGLEQVAAVEGVFLRRSAVQS